MSHQQIIDRIAQAMGITSRQIRTVITLLQDGNTIPFIARYRKEATGLLNEVQLREIKKRYDYEQTLACRRNAVRQAITEQGKWTEKLASRLENAQKLQDIEDLYLPYRPKKQTKASLARKAGLEPLADIFWKQELPGLTPEEAAKPFTGTAAATAAEAICGASAILAERMAD